MPILLESLPEAIRNVPKEEEQWVALGFVEPNLRIIQVGRIASEGVYYQRSLEGTSDPAWIPELKKQPAEEIDRSRALDMRRAHDPQWGQRPELACQLTDLWERGFFGDEDTGVLVGYRELQSKRHEDFCCTVIVGEDGEIRVRIEDDAVNYVDHKPPVAEHEYLLPKGSYWVGHELTYADKTTLPKQLLGRDTFVVSQVGRWLDTMQYYFGNHTVIPMFHERLRGLREESLDGG